MINVLSLVPYNFLPPKMGGQKGIAFFNDFFSKTVSLTCVSVKSNDVSAAKNYEVLPLLSNSKFRYINVFYFFTLKKIIKEKRVTHLVVEHPYYGWLGFLLKQFCGIKLIVHSHNIESVRFKSIGKWWWGILWHYEKFTYRRADHIFFVTEEDKDFVVAKFKVAASKCHTITYGIDINKIPSSEERQHAKKQLQQLYHISEKEKILLFNGTLDYKPNLDGVDTILKNINPLLLADDSFQYKIIICGKGLPSGYNELKDFANKNIIYAGFVDDINIYFKGADIFINPVTDGGGIKTKLVEALGNDLSAVSTKNGAIGVPASFTGNKMLIAADGWQDFATAILQVNTEENTPAVFFDHFYWGNIATTAQLIIA